VVAFNSEESRAAKNVAFIEENFGHPQKNIEVRTNVPRFFLLRHIVKLWHTRG
jgi:hypothetical protein